MDGIEEDAIKATCHCDQRWIREVHPDYPWPHAGCDGAGDPCENPECPW